LQQETDIWIQHDQCWLNWISPARLLLPKSVRRPKKNENSFCRHRSQLDFANLNNRLYDTLAELLRQRVDRLPSRRTDETQRLEMADVFWMDYSYYNNQGNEKPMGGLLGRLLLDTEEMPLEQWCYWILGQYVGIGQRRSFGWGRYQLESIETGRTIPRASAKTSLLELACKQENLETAYLEIGKNKADVERLTRLRKELLQDEYIIPSLHEQTLKEDSQLLQVPPFFDRVAQRAVAQVLTPALDTLIYSRNRVFSKNSVSERRSFGFRRGRSRHSAAQMIQRAYQAGYRWVFESDIDDFFDNIQWSRLYTRLTAFFGDDAVVDLVMGWMSATVEGKERKAGLPQGSPLSPLLANMMLSNFDSDLEEGINSLKSVAVTFLHHLTQTR
jgi:hypothetical protein